MEAILEQLGLSTLLETFSDEKVDPRVVLAMSESALIRLGVATMGDRIRIKQLCKEAVDCDGDSNGADSVNRDSSASSTSAAEQVREERRLLFCPYNQSGANRGRSASAGRAAQKKKGSSKRTWTGQFVCLADRHASRAPSSGEKQVLQQAGLGLKKIRFFVDDSEVEVKAKLTSDMVDDSGEPMGFPQLKEAKGFEILSCSSNSRDLTVVKTAWSVKDLKSVFTSQTKIYLRPIQKNLRTKSSQQSSLVCKLKETCMWCQREFPVNELRAHLLSCSCNLFEDDPTDDIAESPPSIDVGVVDAGNHGRSSHTVTANSNLPTIHLTLSGVAPFPTPEATSLGTPPPPTVSPVSTQVPSGTASQDATHTATRTGPADSQVPSPEASVTIPLQAGADLEGTQLPSVPSSFNFPAQSEFVFSGTLVPSEVASLNTPVQYEVGSAPLDIPLVSEIAPLDISRQSGVATLGIPVPSEPEPSVPEPGVELDTVILEITVFIRL